MGGGQQGGAVYRGAGEQCQQRADAGALGGPGGQAGRGHDGGEALPGVQQEQLRDCQGQGKVTLVCVSTVYWSVWSNSSEVDP